MINFLLAIFFVIKCFFSIAPNAFKAFRSFKNHTPSEVDILFLVGHPAAINNVKQRIEADQQAIREAFGQGHVQL